MSRNLSTWSIDNPVAVVLLFVLLTAAGLAGFVALPVQDFPDIDFPEVTISAELPGASPPQLEVDVARRIEDAVAGLQGIRHVHATLRDGTATVTAEFAVGKPVQEAMDEVRDAVSAIRADLPADLRDPVITRRQMADAPVVTYVVSSDVMDEEALSWFVDHDVSRRLRASPGIGAVQRVGGVDREVRVALDPDRMAAIGATAADVSRRLRQLQQEASGGRTDIGGGEQSVRTIATVDSAEAIGALELSLADGRRMRLDRVAAVEDTVAEPRAIALLDGRRVVAFDVLRARGAGEIAVRDAAREAVAALAAEHPEIRIDAAVDAVGPIKANYRGSMMLLVEGAVLAVVVVFLFLRDWRATFIAAVALPLSAIPTFALMQLLGFSLNTVSLLSLSLVVGVLVDDAIVEIENIERHLAMGKAPPRAARDAASEIGLAVVATTLTLVAVFLPTSLMGGTIGLYFVQFGWTAAIAVLFSLLVARMLTPTMAAWLLRAPRHRARTPRWVVTYLRLLRWCGAHRRATLAGAALLVVAGLGLAATLPGEFMPADDGDRTQVTVSLPPGGRIGDTLAVAERARAIVAAHPAVTSVFTTVGAGTTGGDDDEAVAAEISTAVLAVNLLPRGGRDGLRRQAVEAELRDDLTALPGARVRVGTGEGEVHEVVLAADDGALLQRHARVVEGELRGIPGVGAVVSSASLVRPELVVRPDFARAAALGVDAQAIAETLRVATAGDYAQDLAKLNLSERQVPIVVRLADSARADLDQLRRLPVPAAAGTVPLGSVAELSLASGPAETTRYDRRRNVSLAVELNGQPLGTVESRAEALPSLRDLPRGVALAEGGEAEVMGELVTGFAVAMLAGVACVYVVLVLLLKDFAQPLTVLVALVLSIPGAFLALWLAGGSLSMPSAIGLIMLMGITTKNAILLVDYIVIARREGMPRRRAIVDACRKRARPIVMTTVAMGAGMLPIAAGIGADPSFRAPMAITVIGGLVASTVLCLLVVPALYAVVDDGVAGLRRRLGRQGAAADLPADAETAPGR